MVAMIGGKNRQRIRNATPPEFRDLLIDLARRTQVQHPDTPTAELRHVLKAEAARPDATDRENSATTSPGGGPMGAWQPAAAGPTGMAQVQQEVA